MYVYMHHLHVDASEKRKAILDSAQKLTFIGEKRKR